MSARYRPGEVTRALILNAIAEYVSEHGWAPTMREIGDAVGIESPSTTHKHLLQLQREGKLVLGGGPRMIRVTGVHS